MNDNLETDKLEELKDQFSVRVVLATRSNQSTMLRY